MHFPAYSRFFLFQSLNNILYTYTTLYPFIHQWTCFSYLCYNEHRVQICLSGSDFISFTCNTQKWNCQNIWQFYFQYLGSLHIVSHRGSHFAFSQQSARVSIFSHLTNSYVLFLSNGHLNKCDFSISHCRFLICISLSD